MAFAFAYGYVKDSGGQGIGGATVTWPGATSCGTATDGSYMTMVPATTYDVTASKTGYQSQTKNGIVYPPDQGVQVDFVLQ